jgi:hypothetical protein
VRASIPIDLQRVEPLLCRPHVIADHGNQIVKNDDLLHARHVLCGAVIGASTIGCLIRKRLVSLVVIVMMVSLVFSDVRATATRNFCSS